MPVIVGRDQETQILETVLASNKAQFLALYGRRRIGKTHLIKNFFGDKGAYFEVTGLKNGKMSTQLEIFTKALSKCFYNDVDLSVPSSWLDAFKLLTKHVRSVPSDQPFIIFFDELPWLATKRSGFLEALDHYWNTEWVNDNNLKLIVCGSAAAWMLDKIINDKGGLHNRLTRKILLRPFNLRQTEQFLQAKKFKLSHKNILDIYMITGGVPYYLEFLDRSLSVNQNINQLCFSQNSPLISEFTQIFSSLFDESDSHAKIIRTIAEKRYGMDRDEIIKSTKISSGGYINKKLSELEAAGFIRGYTPYGNMKKEKYYRIIDEYSLFYLNWIEPHLKTGYDFPSNYWSNILTTPKWQSWAGYSFEGICMKHVDQIQKALHFENTVAMPSSWRYCPNRRSDEQGAQIDLLFDRNDDAITLCEIRYSKQEYHLDKASAKNISNKADQFRAQTKTKKQIFVTLITTYGVKQSLWLDEIIDSVLTLESLFLV